MMKYTKDMTNKKTIKRFYPKIKNRRYDRRIRKRK